MSFQLPKMQKQFTISRKEKCFMKFQNLKPIDMKIKFFEDNNELPSSKLAFLSSFCIFVWSSVSVDRSLLPLECRFGLHFFFSDSLPISTNGSAASLLVDIMLFSRIVNLSKTQMETLDKLFSSRSWSSRLVLLPGVNKRNEV